ncbi:hypothetical protein SERLA73DRAFT_47226 [Serpula lacrymans var. lacrymans S7.3]|uniref:Ribonuclease H1 N-terminal domain-containing protein n=1 Tax=Serpula lacrymans var. lacrymans (strain S7.3) TaxID=936435 RepID=F8PMB3_SERL3|nr:hypothetical protein SERLA73DRAFT_47226 [Serpula lacrymans var. lacrymans S7.3]
MTKAGRSKYYAVRIGREGPKIYATWDEASGILTGWTIIKVSRFPGAVHKSFTSRAEAEAWLHAAKSPEYSSAHASISGPSVLAASHDYSQKDSVETTFIPLDGPLLPQMPLSDEQSRVLDLVKRGRSIFFTGSAGLFLACRSFNPLTSKHRDGKVRSSKRDHTYMWWPFFRRTCNYCIYRYSIGQYRWDDVTLLGRNWPWPRRSP